MIENENVCNNNSNNNIKNTSNNNSNNNSNIEKDLQNQKFDIQTFKTIKCNISQKHNEKHCINYHSNKDRRRSIIKYSSDTCKFTASDKNCLDGDNCLFSHNKVEMFYHPDRFKTKFCSQYNTENYSNKKNLLNCAYGKYCSFAHSEEEIKIELIHKLKFNEEFFLNYFKTVVCPFTHDHDKATCVYSHNWQDYRRNPKKYTYKNLPCHIWDIKKTILNYRDGCPKESSCLSCHGWKEEDFHPLNYKTKKCKNFNKVCEKNIYCPFYHTLEEKRKVPIKIKQEYEMRLDNKLNVQKYSNLLNESFNINRSNSVKSNLSDNVSYNNTNKRVNYPMNSNMMSNMNFPNINQFNNYNNQNILISNKVNNYNYMHNNFSNFNVNNNNHNLNYMQSQVNNIQANNSMNLGNNNNINMMLNNNNIINYNFNKNYQYERNNIKNNINKNNNEINNNYQTQQQKHSFNSVNINPMMDENFTRLNLSSNYISTNKNNIWSFPNQFPYQNNFSPNNSFGKGSFSDNEINDNNNNNNNNQFFNFNQSRSNYRSFSSHFSNSSSDQLNESDKIEKDYEMILGNPDDDSIEINENDNSNNNINNKYISNGANYGKNDTYYIEKIEETNNFLKELIKEGETNFKTEEKESKSINEKVFDNEDNLNKDNFLEFLKNQKMNILRNLIETDKITLYELVKYSDQKIIKLIEPENNHKIEMLINILMKFDEKIEGDNVMECLNNLDFK